MRHKGQSAQELFAVVVVGGVGTGVGQGTLSDADEVLEAPDRTHRLHTEVPAGIVDQGESVEVGCGAFLVAGEPCGQTAAAVAQEIVVVGGQLIGTERREIGVEKGQSHEQIAVGIRPGSEAAEPGRQSTHLQLQMCRRARNQGVAQIGPQIGVEARACGGIKNDLVQQ